MNCYLKKKKQNISYINQQNIVSTPEPLYKQTLCVLERLSACFVMAVSTDSLWLFYYITSVKCGVFIYVKKTINRVIKCRLMKEGKKGRV